ncbi:unnamed protein product, partial [Pleuronectes platessa]
APEAVELGVLADHTHEDIQTESTRVIRIASCTDTCPHSTLIAIPDTGGKSDRETHTTHSHNPPQPGRHSVPRRVVTEDPSHKRDPESMADSSDQAENVALLADSSDHIARPLQGSTSKQAPMLNLSNHLHHKLENMTKVAKSPNYAYSHNRE